jgi:ketosteroid isomerase-like protein
LSATRHKMDPLTTVDAFGAAWGAHDLDATLVLVTDDCVFESTEPGPDGTRYEGRDAIRRAWQPIFDDTHAVFHAEETFVAEDRVVQRWRYSWVDGHVRGVDVFRVRDGLVSEKLSYVKG